MTTTAQLRNQYARDSISTASPARLVVMLYDRLLKDLSVAEQAVVARDIQASHAALIHAQEIVIELRSTLDTTAWREGEALQRLYDWVVDELIQANVAKDPIHIRNARDVIEPIGDAFRQAATQVASTS